MQEHNPMQEQRPMHDDGRKRGWLLAIAIGVPALLVTAALLGLFDRSPVAPEDVPGASQVAIADSSPPASAVDECNRSAELATGEQEGGFGVMPGESAPDDATAGEERAAPEESSSGTSIGMSEQNSQSAKARAAYRDCMARKGYVS